MAKEMKNMKQGGFRPGAGRKKGQRDISVSARIGTAAYSVWCKLPNRSDWLEKQLLQLQN